MVKQCSVIKRESMMQIMDDFVVLDTEGKETLTEIAIRDKQGQLVYEAFVTEHTDTAVQQQQSKPLSDILDDLIPLLSNKTLICHYAAHDREVLERSFSILSRPIPAWHYSCTYNAAKNSFPCIESYALAFLSKHLNLKVDNKFFNEQSAHRARYDTAFTFQLYQAIQTIEFQNHTKDTSNPFSNSRVDTPFQYHSDAKKIYDNEFIRLKSVIGEIKADENRQSRGAVVIGEAGSGKTHLMMRLTQAVLQQNRLLFIRQPNNADSILYHIYSRILESFVEKMPQSEHSRLEYLLAKSFSQIQIAIIQAKEKPTQKDRDILSLLQADHLNIYKRLGKEGSDKKRKNWQYIEKCTVDWWARTYGFSGYATPIIKGLIKFCSYSAPHKRELVRRWLAGNTLETAELESIKLENWHEELSKETFALEAISVFSKLSIADNEPLIVIFDQLEGLKYYEKLLFNFGEALKELFTHAPNTLFIINLFPDRWDHFLQFFDNSITDRISQHQIRLQRPNLAALHSILTLKAQEKNLDINVLFTPEELTQITQQGSIRAMLNYASDYYRYKVDGVPLPHHSISFEERILKELNQLKEEITLLKRQLPQTEKPSSLALRNPDTVNYLTAQRTQQAQNYSINTIITDSDDFGKLFTIFDALKLIKKLTIDYLYLGKRKLPEHVLITLNDKRFLIGFLQVDGASFTSRIKNFNELVLQYPDITFYLFRDARHPLPRGKVALHEIEKLKHMSYADFKIMEKENRITFEMIYHLITDIQNRDLDVDLETALFTMETILSRYWLVDMLKE